MKHIKLFENFNKSDLEQELDRYGIKKYTINNDGTVDVDGNIYLLYKSTKIPIKFGKVTGDFNFNYIQVTSLEGSPYYVGGNFNCTHNKLTSLEGSPYYVGGNFNCSNNQLTSLNGSPKEVGGDFNCANNQLTSLNGSPIEVGGDFNCSSNKLNLLEGMPLEIGRNFSCYNNPDLKELDSISNIEGDIICDSNIITSKFRGFCRKIITDDDF